MTGTDPATEISELSSKLSNVEAVLNPDAMGREADRLKEEAADPGLWGDQERAQAVTRRLSYLEGELGRLRQLHQRLDDTRVMFELADSENDEPTRQEATRDLAALRTEIDQLEIRTLLSGEYDARDALISINAQAGGADAADFAQNLQRMYLRWAERHGYPTEIYYTSYAEEAGIKSTTFVVKAPYAYGTLRGGQGVNTTDSAVRLTHLPTGIVVSCQNERSQMQNKATAMAVLKAKLLERKREEQEAKMASLRGESTSSWGTQIRNYVLHPYQNVKDVRTGLETGNTGGVLDGDIDDFIEAEIRWLRTHSADGADGAADKAGASRA